MLLTTCCGSGPFSLCHYREQPRDSSLATSTTLLLCFQSACTRQPEPKGQTSPTPWLAHTYCPCWKAPVISPATLFVLLLVLPRHFSSVDLGCRWVRDDGWGVDNPESCPGPCNEGSPHEVTQPQKRMGQPINMTRHPWLFHCKKQNISVSLSSRLSSFWDHNVYLNWKDLLCVY